MRLKCCKKRRAQQLTEAHCAEYDQLKIAHETKPNKRRLRLRTVEIGGIAPKVPAAIFVDNFGHFSLRVDYDDVVQFSDFVVSRVSSEYISDTPSTPSVFYLAIFSVQLLFLYILS